MSNYVKSIAQFSLLVNTVSKKESAMYKNCKLCKRECGVDRTVGERGFCGMSDKIYISRAALHRWEEPPISGSRGSGTVFFSGCSLGCIYCQNREISRGRSGKVIIQKRLVDIMLRLQAEGAHNINFVTPTHYAPTVISAVSDARDAGLCIPIVYNTGSYETKETVRTLKGTVDIWLPDLKYYRAESAKKYSAAEDLPEVSRAAIAEMVEMAGEARFDENGIMQSGVIVRILLLPMHVAEAKLNVKYLYETFGDKIYISLMSQYTPCPDLPSPLCRKVSAKEYDELVDYALKLGVRNAFIQDTGSADESFIPPFDYTGV